MNIILAAALLLSDPTDDLDSYVPAEWIVDSRVIACSPDALTASGTLLLRLGPGHGQELAIRRVSDNAWYFLVVMRPPDDVPQVMTPEELSRAKSVEIPASFESREWALNAPLERIFNKPGAYEAYTSDILESELGGYVCSFNYIGVDPEGTRPGVK